jgi:hypothetical protein
MGKYTLSGDNKILIRYEGEEKIVNIPECIMQIGEHAFENCIQLEEIVIPSNIKNIKEFAFSGCKNLKRVKLHDDISFENNVFYDCPSLLHDIVCNHKLIRVPMSYVWEYVVAKDIDTIVGGAFQGCNEITNVSVYPELKAIGNIKFDELISFQIGYNVAIVKKNKKYGAVSLDGEETVSTIYDELSDFEDGFALAKYNKSRLLGNPHINVEERLFSTSGQVLVRTDHGNILLPKEYDWGTNFINNLSIVVKNEKIGVIDINGNLIVPIGKYVYISFIYNDLITVSEDSFEIEEYIDNQGIKQKKKETCYIKWGIIDSTGKEIIPCKYSGGFNKILSFGTWSNDFIEVLHGNIQYDGYLEDAKVGVYSISRIKDRIEHVELIVPIAYDEVSALSIDEHQKPPFVIAKKGRYNDIFDLRGRLLLSFDNKNDSIVESSYYGKTICLQLHTRTYYITEKGVYFELKGCGLFKEENGELYLLGLQYSQKFSSCLKRTYSIESLDYLDGMIVERDYLSYRFYELGEDSLGVCCNTLWGIADKKGCLIVPIQYHSVCYGNEDGFIVSKMNDAGELKYGTINSKNQILLPISYNYIGVFKNFFVYSNNAIIKNAKEANKYECTTFNSDSLFGIMDSAFNLISLPNYSAIVDASETCIKVCKDNKYGILNKEGNMIIDFDEYDYVEIFDENYIKVAKGEIKKSQFVNRNKTYSKWGVIDPKGEDIVLCMYSSLSIISVNNEYYILACFKIIADDMYDEYDIITGVYDDWEKENYYYLKENENDPKFGQWKIMDKDGMDITEDVEGFEEDAKNALMAHLNIINSSSDDRDDRHTNFSKYGGYNDWDDDSIDEAFDSDPELTWNVD